jgi:hypothetical protein
MGADNPVCAIDWLKRSEGPGPSAGLRTWRKRSQGFRSGTTSVASAAPNASSVEGLRPLALSRRQTERQEKATPARRVRPSVICASNASYILALPLSWSSRIRYFLKLNSIPSSRTSTSSVVPGHLASPRNVRSSGQKAPFPDRGGSALISSALTRAEEPGLPRR